MKIVYVALVTPNEKHLSPYIYGIFDTDEQAYDHFRLHGDKTATLKVMSAQYMTK